MITKSKLKLYQKYDGDLDGLSRSIDSESAASSIEEDWRLIEHLRSGLWSIHMVACADSYKEQVQKEVEENTADNETRDLLLIITLKQK